MKSIRLCLIIILLPTLVQATELSIFAASSLTEVLREVVQTYQINHPDEKISLHFAGSQALATQIEQGAPADLYIAADIAAMTRLHANGFVENPRTLLHNKLVLAVQPEFRTQLSTLKDLAQQDLLLVIGNRHVPIGKYTRQLFQNLAGDPEFGAPLIKDIEQQIVSEENMVKAIITKLLLGEVDAGIVYQSDLFAENTNKLIAIRLPEQHNPVATYPVAKTTEARGDSQSFLTFLFGNKARQIFTARGFLMGAGS